jgi:Dolichyl-phosphate-mannose-protein mannosyltransferase
VTAIEQTPGLDAGVRGTAPAVAWAGWRTVRNHWCFVLVLTAGLALRTLTGLAYRPALLYIDSAKYLAGSGGTAPEGYQALLRVLAPIGGLALVAAVQHTFGLAMAIAVYALLLRRGAPRWAATLAAAPVLLDAYQVQLEQTVMPDVLFETMITAGLVVLLWSRRPGLLSVSAGALVLGAAVTVREIGGVLIGPAVVFAVLSVPGWRQKAGRGALTAGCFALPVLGYMTGALVVAGHFGLASNGPAPEYGRAAAAADCATVVLPAGERALCPSAAETLALGGIDGLLHNPRSPGHTVPVPPGTSRDQLLDRFAAAVFRQQPLRVAVSVARDSVRLFALTRDGDPQVTSIARWQFQPFYPVYPRRYTMAFFTQLAREHGSGGDLVAVEPAARILRDYQLGGGYTPGPLYAAGLAAGLLGALTGLSRRRAAAHPELASACLLVTLAAVVLLLSSDAFEYSWRYQLPAVVMLPLAGALGVTALVTAARTATGGTGRRTRPASAESGPRAPAVR